jgi:formylglycine-generating enzyme required for sulfatase activity
MPLLNLQGRAVGRDDRPVIEVDIEDARAYTSWLNAMTGGWCRLPSEAEWEYAARAGTTAEYALPAPNGSDDIKSKGLANCTDCGSEWENTFSDPVARFDPNDFSAPVASFDPNAWGLYDMHGNVAEWVEDCWHASYAGAPKDGRPWLLEHGGNCANRVTRGGPWDKDHSFARSARRSRGYELNRLLGVGFRVLCSSIRSDRPKQPFHAQPAQPHQGVIKIDPGTGFVFKSNRITKGIGADRDIWWNGIALVPDTKMMTLVLLC